MPRAIIRRLAAGALLPLLVTGLPACENDSLTDPEQHLLGNSAFEFTLDAGDAGRLPSGTLLVLDYALMADTQGVADVFGRMEADGFYRRDPTNFRYIMTDASRHGGTDPRLPALTALPNPSAFGTNFVRVMGPEWWKDPFWNVYGQWVGMQPSTRYTIALERLATEVHGVPDALEFLLEGSVSQPDWLVPLDGAPGGFPAVNYAWTTRAACLTRALPSPMPNPWYLGAATSTAAGQLTLDMCFGSPWQWYRNQDVAVADSSLVLPNSLTRATAVPQYNYLVIYQGEPPNLGPPVLRIQMGADLASNGQPLRNAFAPFPLAADRPGFLARANVELGPREMTFDLRNLEPLAGGSQYELWLVNAKTGTRAAATADHFRITTHVRENEFGERFTEDEASADTARTARFAGVPQANVRHGFNMRNALLGGARLQDFTHLVLAEPGSADADRAPLWISLRDAVAADFRFGAFNRANPALSRVFRAEGAADGTLWDDQLGIQFRRLLRPPPGYFYELWAVKANGEARSLGGITTPVPELQPLRDADANVYSNMTETQILRAARHLRLAGENAFDLAAYDFIRLTLEPKAGVPALAPTIILQGPVPEALKKARGH
jgi:hypothetical protein